MKNHYEVLIVGGGTGGITVAAQLRHKANPPEMAIIEPSTKHYYQPIWTLVGGGVVPKEVSERDEADYIPAGVDWIPDAVASFDPDNNQVTTRGGRAIGYDYLVVAAGIQIDWDKIPGLKESVGKPGTGVCSNYDYATVESTWENIRNFKGGTAIFTMPGTPIKCGGAPQKILYLAEDYFRQHGVRDKSTVVFASAGERIFGVEKYRKTLEEVVARKGIETWFQHDLIALHPDQKEAVFKKVGTDETVTAHYDMIHVTPPMSAPDFLKVSPLANAEGWVDVDKFTLRHVRYPNVFALGDASSLPTSKTGAAIRKEAPVLVKNLMAVRSGKTPVAQYHGYTSCPVVTGYGTLVLAEFDYDGNPDETFPFNQAKERHSMYLMKKYALPAMYWHGMLRGRA
ncbi:MAG: NAD(P)/FAD-dependent oxidoreductase [Caldilineaceae bacterium]|nr:NAD(P)/FAD-dependent oxidoreductase [Caldilineaceae bacterium]